MGGSSVGGTSNVVIGAGGKLITGEENTLGSVTGDFATGAVFFNGIPFSKISNPITADAATGGVSSFLGNGIGQFINTKTGQQDNFDGIGLISDSAIGSVTGLVAGGTFRGDPLNIPGFTSGSNNFSANLRGLNAKIANGRDINISNKVLFLGTVADQLGAVNQTVGDESLKVILNRITNSQCRGLSVPCQK